MCDMDKKKTKSGKGKSAAAFGRKPASGPVGAFLKGLSGR